MAACLDRSSHEAVLFAAGAPRVPFVFFDLETTGLSGGAGTLAFLVGCAWFEPDGGFRTRQFLLTRYADERSLLESVAAEFARAGALVSFNGKSFDAPLLETRYLFHRLPWAGAGMPHVDVLHPGASVLEGDGRSKAVAPRYECSGEICRRGIPTVVAPWSRSSGRFSDPGAAAMSRGSRFPVATSSSSAAATRGRSKPCSSTIVSIY